MSGSISLDVEAASAAILLRLDRRRISIRVADSILADSILDNSIPDNSIPADSIRVGEIFHQGGLPLP